MKVPATPPNYVVGLDEALRSGKIVSGLESVRGPSVQGKYLHWDKLRFYPRPEGLTHEEWWIALSFQRRLIQKTVPLLDTQSRVFRYLLPDPIPQQLHLIDQGSGGIIQMPEPLVNPHTKDRYYINSLIEEAITSSQLEGATTTRQVAKEMLRAGREPRDRSERMILNNFQTMRMIGEYRDAPLTPELVLEIHRLVTEGTLDDPSTAGRLRLPAETVVVGDAYGEIFHIPPPADQLERRLAALCHFANDLGSDSFVHPVVRSILLHFWLAYDHPFVDGNGRTARALFYWSMLRNGFWLFEFISISTIIVQAPVKYGRAFLYTETDENDLTYFILYHLEVIMRAIEELHRYIQRKAVQLQEIEQQVRGISLLNHRQRSLMMHALRHPQQRYTVEAHRSSHNVVYETARADLMDLNRRGLLEATKIGKAWSFQAPGNLEQRLVAL